jgi:hypothetical protein
MILQNIHQLQAHNLKLAKYLFKYGYKPIPADNSIPYYSYKNSHYSLEKCISYLEQSNNINTNVCVIVDDFLVLDVDTLAEIQKLKFLSAKYNCTSNLVVRTKHGYHVYYSVNYPVKSQNNSNCQIAIKCNSMPITAPFSYRNSKQHLYKSVYKLINSTEIKNMPYEMYCELVPAKPETKPPSKPASQKPLTNYSKYDLPVAEYLSKLDTSVYLFGDRIAWLRILSACKNTNDCGAFDSCFNWSKQGKYGNMTMQEFKRQWQSANGVSNGYGFLNKVTK